MGAGQLTFGQLLREGRKQQQMTLRDLEARSGVSYSQLSKIERGESVPLRTNVEKLADALGGNRDEWLYSAGYLPDIDYIYALKSSCDMSGPQAESRTIQEQDGTYAGQGPDMEQFNEWLAGALDGIRASDQRQLLEELKDYVEFKKYQLKRGEGWRGGEHV
ncbi:helix-turn-helix domain-containing protein [Paenibacillus sp. GCM10027626]|uniref:helix-turn-helix domain-containing protein n=1 Tax=Paenibacillus sp. GCM10027626 TaxID=3273411 RepID=UPI0036365E27